MSSAQVPERGRERLQTKKIKKEGQTDGKSKTRGKNVEGGKGKKESVFCLFVCCNPFEVMAVLFCCFYLIPKLVFVLDVRHSIQSASGKKCWEIRLFKFFCFLYFVVKIVFLEG